MQVQLIAHTPAPEQVVAAATRLCHSAVGAAALKENISAQRAQELVEKVIALGHTSTLEHVSFTFAIEGVSRALTHQLVRHRIASYSQQSQRYVAEHDFEYITPPSIANNDTARQKFVTLMEHIRQCYNELTALGIPREDARYVLANATETKIIVTMNARALLNFFRLRCCTKAQWEIRALAETMLAQVRQVAPHLFAHAGPPCVTDGVCREGSRSCGRVKAAAPAAGGGAGENGR